MLFNSITFIVFYINHDSSLFKNKLECKKNQSVDWGVTFLCSLNPPFILLLFLSTIVDWKVAKKKLTKAHHTRLESDGW